MATASPGVSPAREEEFVQVRLIQSDVGIGADDRVRLEPQPQLPVARADLLEDEWDQSEPRYKIVCIACADVLQQRHQRSRPELRIAGGPHNGVEMLDRGGELPGHKLGAPELEQKFGTQILADRLLQSAAQQGDRPLRCAPFNRARRSVAQCLQVHGLTGRGCGKQMHGNALGRSAAGA